MNILVCGRIQLEPEDLNILSGDGKDNICYCPNEEAQIPIDESDVDVVVCNWFFKYHDLRDFTKLKYIQLVSSGYNGIDPDEVSAMGIEIHNAKGVYSIPISEFVIGNILAYYKKSCFFFSNRVEHRWEKNRSLRELYEKRVLIIGTGSIGNEIAKRLSVFTSQVYGCNRTPRDNNNYRGIFPLDELSDVIGTMDVIILTIALTGETKHLIDRPIFEKLKRDVLIVNVSRGDVIDERELITFLKENKSSGAVLDVFENEPLSPDDPLWDLDNAIITPHNAFVSDRNQERLRNKIIEKFREWLDRREIRK